MLADMKAKVYCLHPGRMKVKVAGHNEKGEPTNKMEWAYRYFKPKDLMELYGIDRKLCVTWGPECVGWDHLIHLKPDPKGIYELPVMEAPSRSSKSRKSQK